MTISTRPVIWGHALWISLSLVCAPVSAQVPELVPVPMTGPGVSGLPVMGGSESSLSWTEERKIGNQIAYQIQQDVSYERDSLLHEYVNGLWFQLLDAARRDGTLSADLYQRMAWKMFLIRDPSVNAFALPGAYIGVNLGLISVTDTRDELASVLAHESVHIFQRHIARLYGQSKDASLLALASMIVGALAASANPSAAAAIFTSGQALAMQGQIDFTRAMEFEADRLGYKVLVGASFRPQGMSDMFHMLADASRYNDNNSFPYLRTHPLSIERIAEAQTRLGIEVQEVGGRPLDHLHALMSARARVLATTMPDALRQLVATGSGKPVPEQMDDTRLGNLYAGALAAVKLRQFAQAQALLTQLVELTEGRDAAVARVVALLGVEIALAQGDVVQAQRWLGSDQQLDVTWLARPELLMRAQVAVAASQPSIAIELLQPWVFKHADDDASWTLLSTAYRMNNQPGLSLRAEGEVRMAIGDFGGAVDRFKAALNSSDRHNIHDLEVFQARVKAAAQAQKEQMELK